MEWSFILLLKGEAHDAPHNCTEQMFVSDSSNKMTKEPVCANRSVNRSKVQGNKKTSLSKTEQMEDCIWGTELFSRPSKYQVSASNNKHYCCSFCLPFAKKPRMSLLSQCAMCTGHTH